MAKIFAAPLAAAALALLSAGTAIAADDATLRPGVTVSAAQVRLGDLFENAGDHADDIVAAAPAPGSALLLDAPWLTTTAHAHGLQWHPTSNTAQIRVDRDTVTVGTEEVAAKLLDAMAAGRRDCRVQLDNPVAIYLAANGSTEIGINHIELNPDTNRFVAEIRVPANDPNVRPLRLMGKLQSMTDLPVLNHAMLPGEVVKASDITIMSFRTELLSGNNLADPREMIGKTPRHPLRPSAGLRAFDLELPVVVKRNEMVLIVLERPGLYITASGKAMEDGGVGAVIRVTNTQSNRALDAVVLGAGRVAIRPPGIQQAAVN